MNTLMTKENDTAMALGGEWTELVRGREQELVSWLLPAVRREDVALNLAQVERIDAAGIAALVKLYAEAQRAGHGFQVSQPQRHVAAMLRLVGLESILTGQEPSADWQAQRPAA